MSLNSNMTSSHKIVGELTLRTHENNCVHPPPPENASTVALRELSQPLPWDGKEHNRTDERGSENKGRKRKKKKKIAPGFIHRPQDLPLAVHFIFACTANYQLDMQGVLGFLSFLASLTGTDALGLFGNATVVVHGRAQHFIAHGGLAGATITCEEFPELTATTDEDGLFQLVAPVGANLTLTLAHESTRTTTAATFTVPPEGIPQGAETEVPFQAPLKARFHTLRVMLYRSFL